MYVYIFPLCNGNYNGIRLLVCIFPFIYLFADQHVKTQPGRKKSIQCKPACLLLARSRSLSCSLQTLPGCQTH